MGKFACPRCNREHTVIPSRWRCDCGSFLDLQFKATFPIGKIRRRGLGIWRYREAIPLHDEGHIITLGEGFTPRVPMEVDHHRGLMKIDYLFPTGSYKDRGVTVSLNRPLPRRSPD